MLRVVSAALTLSIVGFCGAPLHGQTGASGSGGVNFQSSLNTALQRAGEGQLILARSEAGGVFGCYFLLPNGRILEIEMRGGRIIKEKEISGEFSQELLDALKARKGAKMPFTRFMELASGEVKDGSLSRVEVKLDGKNIRVQIDVVAANQTRRVEIDLATGKVVKVSSV
jgi:hypothetical protein